MLETKAATLLQLLHGLSGSLHVTFEEGTCAAWLNDLLKSHVAQVLVCDPRKDALRPATRIIASMLASWRTFSDPVEVGEADVFPKGFAPTP